jgi:hypothetical protein
LHYGGRFSAGRRREAAPAQDGLLGCRVRQRQTCVLALHTHEKALPDEAGSVRRLGMTYTHIPVDFPKSNRAQFCAVMEQFKDAPIHMHCIANYRVSAFFYR